MDCSNKGVKVWKRTEKVRPKVDGPRKKDRQDSKVYKGPGNNLKNSEAPQTFNQRPIGDTGMTSPIHKPNVVAALYSFASPLRVPSLPGT